MAPTGTALEPFSLNVINFWAEPGAGKSTLRAGLFHWMKLHGYEVEEVSEYAKDATYREDKQALDNQLYMLAKQDMRIRRLVGKVKWAISDSPLPLCGLYATMEYDFILPAIHSAFRRYHNHNFLVLRTKPYQTFGRSQTVDEAEALSHRVKNLFNSYSYRDGNGSSYRAVTGDNEGVHRVVELLGL